MALQMLFVHKFPQTSCTFKVLDAEVWLYVPSIHRLRSDFNATNVAYRVNATVLQSKQIVNNVLRCDKKKSVVDTYVRFHVEHQISPFLK